MKKARTILAIMLALVMVLSILPASFADNKVKDRRNATPESVSRGTSTQSKTLRGHELRMETADTSDKIDPDTIVNVIVVFEEPALCENFTAEEIRAKKAEAVQQRMSNAHDVFFKALGFEAKRVYDYTALVNGMALKTAYKNLSAMEKMEGVSAVYVANEYNAPVVEKPDQAYANFMTGAADMQDVNYKGEGMVVAVLDTGLNLTHEAFQDYGVLTDPAFDEEYVESVYTIGEGKYVSAKVPFAYDYYDEDDDVTDYEGHGSHVSGTVAGYALDDDDAILFSGVAPQAQLVSMKIFPDGSGGTSISIYLAALEDCFLLGVDALNMSIGSPTGYTYDWQLDPQYADYTGNFFGHIFKALDEAGIIVCCSAGNEDSMAVNAANYAGDGYVLAEYADYGVTGSPGTYDGNLAVASMENLAFPYYGITYGDENYYYADRCEDGEHGWLDTFGGKELEVVYCGLGNPDEIPDEVAGKIALVQRGSLSFSEKIANVAEKGAIGMIVFNNTTGKMGMAIDTYYVPAIAVEQIAGEEILAGLAEDNKIFVPTEQVDVVNADAWLMSDFSSWGCTPDLKLKPGITAPGGMIYSSVAGDPDAYEVYSGTSMASPNACASLTLLAQYIKENYPTLSKVQRAELVEDLAESTADVPYDQDDYLYSPRKSGAGLLNLRSAIETPVYVMEPIVNLYDDPDKTGVFTIRYTLVNLSDVEQEYEAFVVGLCDYVVQGYNTLTSDYLFDGSGLTVEGDLEAVVPANGVFDGKIKITLDDNTKAYFDQTFENGNFFEGYIAFDSASPAGAGMVVPIVEGILGDANLDTMVTAGDAAEILRAVVGLTELSEEAKKMADVNQDGEITAADAAFLLRAVVGLVELPYNIVEEAADAPEVHLTFMGFYGDWTQGPVLDKVWANDPNYLMYWAALNVYYPQYAAQGYMPEDLFNSFESNLGVSNIYLLDYNEQYLINYLGLNPALSFFSEEDEIWAEYFMNDQYANQLHHAFTTDISFTYSATEIDILPLLLRNAMNLYYTIRDAETGEIYYEDGWDYSHKSFYSSSSGTRQMSELTWDGYVNNEESDLYGTYVENAICVVTIETMIDYPTAVLTPEKEFYVIVDSTAPEFGGFDIDGDNITFSFSDALSGMAFVEAMYETEDGYEDAALVFGDNALSVIIDTTELPEDVEFLYLDFMDYATNLDEVVFNVKTGRVMEGASVAEAAGSALYDESSIGEVWTVEGVVTDIYKGIVYISDTAPLNDGVTPLGMAVKLADATALENIHVGDGFLFEGELDNYYGCPRLDKAEILYQFYENEDYEYDVGDYVWDNVIYPLVLYPLFGLGEEITFDAVMENPSLYVGSIVYLEDLEVIGVTEVGDGTRTITISDGLHSVDIVGCTVGADTYVGDAVYYGYFVPVYDLGNLRFRPLQDGEFDWLVFYSDVD